MTDLALWSYGRASGVVDLLLFTLVAVLGIVSTSGRTALGMSRTTLTRLHRTASATAVIFLVVHVLTLTLNGHARLSVEDWGLPFAADRDPIAYGLGTCAVDLLLVVIASGLVRRLIPERAFRVLHTASYALLPFALVHALAAGTDGGSLWLIGLVLACAAVLAATTLWRLTPRFSEAMTGRRADRAERLAEARAARTGSGTGAGLGGSRAPIPQPARARREYSRV